MKAYLKRLFQGLPLSREEARSAMESIMEGQASPEELAGFLGAIAARGETRHELVGCVEAMRSRALLFPVKRTDLIDVCGTGGDGADTFNVSTANALLLAASGLGVVKHGNRAVSSLSGSADVLEELKIAIDGSPEQLVQNVEDFGFAFLFAPMFHPAMRNIAPIRKALGVRTIFNLLGPLANPAPVKKQVVGVFEQRLVQLIAESMLDLGTEEGLVVWGEDGLDEISIAALTQVARVHQGRVKYFKLAPEDFGLPRAPLASIKGGSSETNARIILDIFEGKKGPTRDVVVINAAAALVIAGRAKTWLEGARLAESIIDSGKALGKVKELQAQSLKEVKS
ncbi:MAG: anthranilate phosphoribosyltransferase [Oligoflexus sp.]|nr:anthranilate phosphoribosyltransferase [Oligoflexus sp.]